jgi:hypothetical protein
VDSSDVPLWSAPDAVRPADDDDCGPAKVCRNMRDFSFDGMAEPGTDLRSAWKDLLAREGKGGEGSLGDLVLGPKSADA